MDFNLGNIIKRLRIEHSITQEELAAYLGISYQAVSKWETGTTLPDITLLPKIATYFGVKIDDLFSINHEDELSRIDTMLQRETIGENKYMKKVLLGDLALAQGNVETAKEIWFTIPKEDWLGQYEAGERFNRLNEYEQAIECFNNAYESQTAPHKMDMMYSLAFLYKKMGRLIEAKKEWELIIETLITEYETPEDDNDIEWAIHEIAQLEQLIELN